MQQQRKKQLTPAGKAPVKGAAPAKKNVKQMQRPTENARDRPVSEKSVKPSGLKETKEKGNRRDIFLYVVIGLLLVIIALLFFRSCGSDNDVSKTTEYEETVAPVYEPEADIEVDDTRLNLAIMPDYVVTASKPDMLVPYPEQNAYDINLTFIDPYTDEILYQTDLIAPGSVISVPAYSFVYDGMHQYRVEVRAFDKESHDLVSESVAMKAQIMKK